MWQEALQGAAIYESEVNTMFSALLIIYALYLLATDTGRFIKIVLVLLAFAWLIGRLRGMRFSRKPQQRKRIVKQTITSRKVPTARKPRKSFLEMWREESRRMAAAEEIADDADQEDAEDLFCDDAEDEIEPDDPAITFCDEDEPEEEADASCLFCKAAAAEDPEEDAFCEKELTRLYRVRSGLETKKARMLYVWQANDNTISADARAKNMERLQSTKAWRGLQFDLNYVNNEISGLEDYIKRGN